MGLRNRAPSKQLADKQLAEKQLAVGSSEKSKEAGSSSKDKRRSHLKRVAVELVSSDPSLSQLLRTTTSRLDRSGSGATARRSGSHDKAAAIKVEKAISTLGTIESTVISSLFPTSGDTPETFENLAKQLGMTVKEIQGIADDALRGLRGSRNRAGRISTIWN